MIALGLDPGKTTGVALIEVIEKRPTILDIQETKDVTLLAIKHLFEKCDVVVCEDFLVRPHKAKAGAFDWNDMVAPRVIGAATLLAQMFEKKFVLQQPAIKPVGYGFSNQTYKKGKQGMHIQDAVAHAVFYLVKNHLAVPVSKAK